MGARWPCSSDSHWLGSDTSADLWHVLPPEFTYRYDYENFEIHVSVVALLARAF